jgi:hypothetical protein
VIHGFGAGSDAKLSFVLVVNVACVLAVVFAVWWRVASGWPDHLGERLAGLTASVLAPVLLLAWLTGGPLATGWARKAGTPASLLAGSTPAAAPQVAAPTTPTTIAPTGVFTALPFTANLDGRVTQSPNGGGDQVTVRLSTTLSSGADGVLTVDITGRPVDDGGVLMQTSRVTLGTNDRPALYDGQVTDLRGTDIGAVVSDGSGVRVRLAIAVQIDRGSARVSGTVRGDAA